MKGRTYKLLNRLLDSDIPLTIKYLSVEFEVSERTIRNEINEINDFLLQNNLNLIELNRSKGVALQLDDGQKDILENSLDTNEESYFLSREERVVDILLDTAFGNSPVFLNRKEQEFKVSKSTLDEDMRQVRSFLKQFQVNIVSIPKLGLQFQAKEQFLRNMLFSLISEELGKNQKTIDEIISRFLPVDYFMILDRYYSLFVSDTEDSYYRSNFILLTVIWVLRVKQNKFIACSKVNPPVDFSNKSILEYVQQVCLEFNLSVDNYEKQSIYFLLNSLSREKSAYPGNWLDLQMMILRLIDFVGTETDIPFEKKESQLQESLYAHMSSMVERIKQNVQLVNPLKEKIKQTYGIVYLAIEKFMRNSEADLGGLITDDEIAFLTIHFSTALSEINQENKFGYRAIVICNHGVATGKLLAENLKEYFNIEVLAILGSRELALVDKFDIDLIFSTVQIGYQNKPVMVLDSIFSDESRLLVQHFLDSHQECRRLIKNKSDYTDLFQRILSIIENEFGSVDTNVYQQIESQFQSNYLNINRREVQPMIQDILSEDNISFVEGEYQWKDSIVKVAEPLLQQEAIETRYIDAMIQSIEEYGPYIVIGPHLALAHARPEDGALKLGLSLSIFETPVQFHHDFNDPVKIIFCLSAIDSYSHLNIMKTIVNLIREEDNLQRLMEAKNSETVKQILFQNYKEDE